MSIRLRLLSILGTILVFGLLATFALDQMRQVANLHKLNALHLSATLALNQVMQRPQFGIAEVAKARAILKKIRRYPEECLQSLGVSDRLLIHWAGADALIGLCRDDLKLADLTLARLDTYASGQVSPQDLLPKLQASCVRFIAHSNAFLAPVSAVGRQIGWLLLMGMLTLWVIATSIVIAVVRGIDRSVIDLQNMTQALAHSEQHNRRLAEFDSLTGLPNRHHFSIHLQQAVAHVGQGDGNIALLFVDLDHFKDVNDALGHRAGDELLKVVAARLPEVLRGGDTVARLGGDEFAIILDSIAGPRDPALVAEQIIALMAAPVMLEGSAAHVTASIGITLCPQDANAADELLKNADLAMYAAKAAGRNAYRYYSTDLDEHMRRRLRDEQYLRHGLEHDEFRVYYHPIIDLNSGQIVANEALLRWHHPEFGLVLPEAFIGLAEDTGLICPIGRWVLASALAQTQLWRVLRPELSIAVNVSVRQLRDPNFVEQVAALLAQCALPAEHLHLEITESLFLEQNADTTQSLRQLGALGVRLCIDDFGTGYSSFGYLRQLPFRQLKIDRSFIERTPGNSDAVAVTTAIVRMAQSLGLEVVAEGIESAANLAYLRHLGCGFGQGFLFTPPLAAGDFDPGRHYPVASLAASA